MNVLLMVPECQSQMLLTNKQVSSALPWILRGRLIVRFTDLSGVKMEFCYLQVTKDKNN